MNLPIGEVYDDRGAFRSAAELRRQFSPLDLSSGREVITYCTIGGRACTTWFVLEHLLGRDQVRVYDGSWAEWGKLPATPVETAQRASAIPRAAHQVHVQPPSTTSVWPVT